MTNQPCSWLNCFAASLSEYMTIIAPIYSFPDFTQVKRKTVMLCHGIHPLDNALPLSWHLWCTPDLSLVSWCPKKTFNGTPATNIFHVMKSVQWTTWQVLVCLKQHDKSLFQQQNLFRNCFFYTVTPQTTIGVSQGWHDMTLHSSGIVKSSWVPRRFGEQKTLRARKIAIVE